VPDLHLPPPTQELVGGVGSTAPQEAADAQACRPTVRSRGSSTRTREALCPPVDEIGGERMAAKASGPVPNAVKRRRNADALAPQRQGTRRGMSLEQPQPSPHWRQDVRNYFNAA